MCFTAVRRRFAHQLLQLKLIPLFILAEGSKAAAVGAAHGALYGVGAVIGGTKAGVGMIADGTVKIGKCVKMTKEMYIFDKIIF